jgi:hypothetical protein
MAETYLLQMLTIVWGMIRDMEAIPPWELLMYEELVLVPCSGGIFSLH